jgi:hypothetical protein
VLGHAQCFADPALGGYARDLLFAEMAEVFSNVPLVEKQEIK